jgi:hypothetical protein
VAGLGFVAAYRTPAHVHELFWLSVAGTLATTAATFALATDKRRAGAVLAAVLAALLSLPKFLRAPQYFAFYDEHAHLRATESLLDGARLFAANPLNRAVADYPGLHAITAALATVTGGSVFTVGNLLILAVRIAGCLAVYLIAARFAPDHRSRPAGGARLGLLAVVVFVANPAFTFFDAQFAYESLAAPLVAVVLLLALRLADPADADADAADPADPADAEPRWRLAVAAMGLTGLVVVTHHGSAYVLAAVLVVMVLAAPVTRRRPPAAALVVAGFAVAATAGWLLAAAGYTLTYVGPYVSSNLASVPEFLSGGAGPRALFGGFLPVPGYERWASYAAVLILFGLYCAGAYALRRARHRADAWLVLALGALYFLSLPLVALRGDQVVKRLWEFAFIGLAPVCAVALAGLRTKAGTTAGTATTRTAAGRPRRIAGRVLAGALVLVVFVGSGVARSGEHIRFPGPFIPSADPRSMTPDMVAAARWLRTTYGRDHRIAGDRTLAAVFGGVGAQIPVTYQEDGYPIWAIVAPEEVTQAVLVEIGRAGLEWIAVDLRTAGRFPLTGFYFDEAEPGAYVDTRLTARALRKFDAGPFRRVYDNGHIVLYRVLL